MIRASRLRRTVLFAVADGAPNGLRPLGHAPLAATALGSLPCLSQAHHAAALVWPQVHPSFLVREGRWWRRRLFRDLTIILAILLVGIVSRGMENFPSAFTTHSPLHSGAFASADFTVTAGDTNPPDGRTQRDMLGRLHP
ncbi:hypothetical protein CPT34_24680 [Rhizobium sophoriradicis]|uniref:Uncharacterized protein n=1 Tax=Rhizobium sophoriradicis TaxID=1535245 RepID=A0A2A5KN83_9HYPH|nr:hypothetical protein CPT34_24680 [Rhizobium sophoriradicis]